MGERKVFSKYIPPDFDPALVPRGKKLSSKDGTVPVRMMLPFSVQCNNCQEFLPRGRKFHSRKERMGGPDGVYLGITRWRFYIKCTQCSRPLSFVTDPKNADYEMESGGKRTFEYTRETQKAEADEEAEKIKEAKDDPLRALEQRVLDSQREMAEIDQLEDILAANAKHVHLLRKGETVLEKPKDLDLAIELTEEDEKMIKSIQFGKPSMETKRLTADDERRAEAHRQREIENLKSKQQEMTMKATRKAAAPIVIRKKRKIEEAPSQHTPEEKKAALSSLLGSYGSDSDST